MMARYAVDIHPEEVSDVELIMTKLHGGKFSNKITSSQVVYMGWVFLLVMHYLVVLK